MFLYFVFSLTHKTQKDSIFFSINICVFLNDGEDSLQFNFCHACIVRLFSVSAAAVPVLKFKASGFFIDWLHDRILKTFFRNPDSTCFQFTPVIMYTVGWISLSAELAKVHVALTLT